MQTILDLAIPDVKPALELYRGTLRQKVSPRYTHARLQGTLYTILSAWGNDRGRIGTEWRFYFIERDDAPSSSLVPDVAYVSFERLPNDKPEAAEQPTIAPDIAVEIISPDDRARDVAEKVDLYLAYGTPYVVVVDPQTVSVSIDEPHRERRFAAEHGSITVVDDLRIDLDVLFGPRG
jgi:Uma2 family endonuclease